MDNIILDAVELNEHYLSHTNRKMSELEYIALLESIDVRGQILPILIYRGRIVDGRHRVKAILELNRNEVIANIIPNNTPLKEVEEMVIATENRRTDTPAQKTIRATYWMRKNGASRKDTSIKFGVQLKDISLVSKIEDMCGMKTLNDLYEKGYVSIGKKKFKNLQSLYKHVKIVMDGVEPTNDDNTNEASFKEDEDMEFILNYIKSNSDNKLKMSYIENRAKHYRMLED